MRSPRNLIFSLLISFFTLPLFSSSVFAQTQSPFDQALQTYNVSRESYNAAHDEYQLARSQYLRFKTLTSENKAREATLAMLQARDEVMITYLKALNIRLNEITAVDISIRTRLTNGLEEEISWFTDHKENLTTAGSLDDLVSDSNEAKSHYNTLGPLFYEVLSQIPFGRVDRIKDRINENFLGVREKVAEIRAETRDEYQLSSRKIVIVDGWLLQTEGKILRSDDKLSQTNALIDTFTSKKTNFTQTASTHSSVLKQLEISLKDLRDASQAIREIIRELKET